MNIGVDLSAIQTNKSGVEWYTHQLVHAMAELLGPDERLFLFSTRETGFEAEAAARDNVTVVHSNFRYQEPWRQLLLPLLLRRHNIDVCFFTNFVLSVLAHCPMVLTIHDLSFKLFPRTHKLRNVIWTRSLVPVSTRRASRVIAVSHNTKLDLLRGMNVNASKVSVVHEGVDPRFNPEPETDDEEALKHYGITRPYVLFVGTLEPRKNLNLLIKGFDRVSRQMPDLHLVLAGKRGWMAQAIFDELERRDLLGRVHVTGYVRDRYLPSLYRQASAFIYPSLYEGFGLPPLEAMASGTPVIVSRSSSLPEVVGEAGVYVDPLDMDDLARAITEVVSDEGLAARLRARGLEQAARFSWERAARETLEILRDAARV
ncbi:MAG: glycosyltransferase family 1 protein [Gaiellales bacterium]|nr:MAG: glycosyltransferase family 1 protein [Gaiellales bacterium]